MPIDSLQPISAGSRRKLPMVVEELTKLAARLGQGAKLPTTRELSAALGVTGATLTRALEQLEGRGVVRCRQGSGVYVGAGVGQRRVGLVFGFDIFSAETSPFGAMVLRHTAERAGFHNERFSYYIDNPAFRGTLDGVEAPGHQDLIDALKAGKLDGIILVSRSSAEQENWLRSFGLPVVSAETSPETVAPGRDVALFDCEGLIRRGVERLKASGCRTIGLIGAKVEHQGMFRRARTDAGLPDSDNWIFSAEKGYRGDQEALGRQLAESWIARGTPAPDGLLVTDDMMARGVLSVFDRHGMPVGKNLTVCSHANVGSRTLEDWSSRILTVKFNPNDMVVALCDMLGALMDGKTVSSPRLVPPTDE